MASGSKITIEADLGLKGAEKTEIYIYEDGRLLDAFFDKTFEDIRKIAKDLKDCHKGSEVEVYCTGEDCTGGFHRWSIDD